MDKIILLLDDSPESSSSSFLSKIISMGIYNFTRNVEGVLYLYNNPNTYRDVAHLHQLDTPEMPVGMAAAPGMVPSASDSMGRYRPRIIGLKNASKECGSTTLAYLMVKELEANYNVVAVEVDKRDFNYFKKDNMVSSVTASVEAFITKYADKDCVIVDINASKPAETACEIVLYLLEPSIIKLNRMVMVNSRAVKELENKKVVLNRSLLEDDDVRAFEKETGIRIFYNMKPVNDRRKHPAPVIKLLLALGFDRLPVPEDY